MQKNRHRRGEARADGKLFWCYRRERGVREVWLSPADFLRWKEGTRQAAQKMRSSEKGKAYAAAYALSGERKKVLRRYSKSPKRKAVLQRYHQSEKRKVASRRYSTSEKGRSKIRNRAKQRRREDPLYACTCRLRARVNVLFRAKKFSKTDSLKSFLGCSPAEAVAHLEAQFLPGMSWENRNLWHIDHIIPLASAKTEEDLYRLCHYKNLQPLWASDNLRKKHKMPL